MKTKTQDGYWPLMITLGVILFGVNLLQELAKVFAKQLTENFSVGA